MPCGDLNGEESRAEGIYADSSLIHFALQRKLMQHCKATILQLKLIENKKFRHFKEVYKDMCVLRKERWMEGQPLPDHKILHPDKAQMVFLCLSCPTSLGYQWVRSCVLSVPWRHCQLGFSGFQRLNTQEKQKSLPLTSCALRFLSTASWAIWRQSSPESDSQISVFPSGIHTGYKTINEDELRVVRAWGSQAIFYPGAIC